MERSWRATRKGNDERHARRFLVIRGAEGTKRSHSQLNLIPTMHATDHTVHRAAPGRFAQRFALASKAGIPKPRMNARVRGFLNDLTRAEPRNAHPFGTFYGAALESVKLNPSVLPMALATVDAFAGELIAAAGIHESACFNEQETGLDETTANHIADDRFIAGIIRPSRDAIEGEIEALEAQRIATTKRIYCLTRKLATYDRSHS